MAGEVDATLSKNYCGAGTTIDAKSPYVLGTAVK